MRITSIAIENFKGIENGTWPIGTVTRITGRNGAGKTSLGRALLYAATGLRPDGSAAAAHYVDDPSKPMIVSLIGDEGTITRKRTKTSGSCTIDNLPQTDAQLEQTWRMPMLALALMIWPGAWFSLDEKKQREVLSAITPRPDMDKLFAEKTGLSVPIDWSQSASKLFSDWSAKRLTLEKEGTTIAGQVKELDKNLEENFEGARDPSETAEALKIAQQDWDDIQEKISQLDEADRQWTRYREAMRQYKIEYGNAIASAGRVVPSNGICPTCKQPWEGAPPAKPPQLPKEPEKPSVPEPDRDLILDTRNRKPALWSELQNVTADHAFAKRAAEIVKGGRERREQLEGIRKALMADWRQAQAVEKALHPKNGIWSDALQTQLGRVSLPGYTFEFTDANGKDCLRVLQASNGNPVSMCSSGERIKFCLALSALIADLCSPPFRVQFLEHTDLVDRVPRSPGFQLIAEKVGKVEDLAVEVVAP